MIAALIIALLLLLVGAFAWARSRPVAPAPPTGAATGGASPSASRPAAGRPSAKVVGLLDAAQAAAIGYVAAAVEYTAPTAEYFIDNNRRIWATEALYRHLVIDSGPPSNLSTPVNAILTDARAYASAIGAWGSDTDIAVLMGAGSAATVLAQKAGTALATIASASAALYSRLDDAFETPPDSLGINQQRQLSETLGGGLPSIEYLQEQSKSDAPLQRALQKVVASAKQLEDGALMPT